MKRFKCGRVERRSWVRDRRKSLLGFTLGSALASISLRANLCVYVLFCGAVWPASGHDFANAKTQDASAAAHAERGLQCAQQGNLPLAEEQLRKAVGLAPDNAAFHSNLGTVLAMEKKFEESTTSFERALKINAADLGVRRYLAANLWQLHRYGEAKKNLLIILRAKPGDSQATFLLGMVSENTGDYAAAAKALASVPALVREHPESMGALARSYYHVGEREQARAWMMELQNRPGEVQGVILGAQIADELQDYETAESLLLSLPADSSVQTAGRYRLALVKFHSKQFEESRRILQQLLDSGQETAEILRLMGWCYQEENRREDAVHAFQDAIRLEPTEETNYLELGRILLAQHRFAAAMELSNRTVNAFPGSARAYLLKGSVDLAADQFTEAIDSFTRVLKLDPSRTDATIGLVRAQAGAGKTQEAKARLEKAIRKFPQKAPLELELAGLLLREGETGETNSEARAERLLLSCVTHDNTLAEAYYQLGDIALRHERIASALAYLEKAEKLDPESVKAHFALSRIYRRMGRSEEAARQTEIYDRLKEKESQRAPSAPPDDAPGK